MVTLTTDAPLDYTKNIDYETIAKIADATTERIMQIASGGKTGIFVQQLYPQVFSIVLADLIKQERAQNG